MKILIIHNKYSNYSGEEAVVEAQINLLKSKGHKVITYFRSSAEIPTIRFGKLKSFFTALYNKRTIREVKELIKKEQPTIVHIHNLYPLISPAILPVIKKMGIPIAMTVHNYRLLCPNGLFFSKGEICEKCTGKNKELNCISNNCENSIFKSVGYALRNYWARKNGYYRNNVAKYLCISTIQKNKLIENDFEPGRCELIPNMYRGVLKENFKYNQGDYIGYVGRISEEKGSEIILKLAERLPNINFKIAGSNDKITTDLKNVEFVGFLSKAVLSDFYKNCVFTLFTSVWNETFGLSIIEAFAHKKPVIASDLGASPEIIKNNKTGLIYKSNNLDDLVLKVSTLYLDKIKMREMGEQAFLSLKEKYTSEIYYQNLIKNYNQILK
ncbi:glycosyltransferase family 4 protein [Lutibacter sp. A64]|uniref:glycosyltransferase family 4 protein n=1 Tax=Lutibacter sp. A64 TaxID=2918526 RepID=UPI001F052F57|nr:glycosyltransferase family 4 protein [Lutibacter sp. A64]UMB54366.1 glycosyltransferase family 4 protein [Lutibacter sp. A64]